MSKKILCFVHAYVGHGREAGAETTMANLLESLVSEGYEVDVLLDRAYENYTETYYHNGVKVIPHTSNGTLNEIVDQYDALISQLDGSERAVYVARAAGIPIIHLVHNTMWQTEGYLGEGCDLAVYNTQWVSDYHEEHKSSPLIMVYKPEDLRTEFMHRESHEWPSVVVHPQIDPNEYRSGPAAPHNCITQVNMFENKNPSVFWELAERFPEKKFLCVLGGYGDQWLGDLPNVEIIENTPDMRAVYSRTRVLLMPSFYESFGRVAVEAAASGIPTVASPTPGLIEALGHPTLYCDPVNVDAWENAIRCLDDSKVYNAYSFAAARRSAKWQAEQFDETKNFVEKMNELVR